MAALSPTTPHHATPHDTTPRHTTPLHHGNRYRAGIFDVAYKLYQRQSRWCDVLRVALRANSLELVASAFKAVTDALTRKQMAFMLAQQRFFYFQVRECVSERPSG